MLFRMQAPLSFAPTVLQSKSTHVDHTGPDRSFQSPTDGDTSKSQVQLLGRPQVTPSGGLKLSVQQLLSGGDRIEEALASYTATKKDHTYTSPQVVALVTPPVAHQHRQKEDLQHPPKENLAYVFATSVSPAQVTPPAEDHSGGATIVTPQRTQCDNKQRASPILEDVARTPPAHALQSYSQRKEVVDEYHLESYLLSPPPTTEAPRSMKVPLSRKINDTSNDDSMLSAYSLISSASSASASPMVSDGEDVDDDTESANESTCNIRESHTQSPTRLHQDSPKEYVFCY